MPASWARETVGRLRAPLVADGNRAPRRDWSKSDAIEERPLAGCQVIPGASTEDAFHAEGVDVAFTIHAPASADVVDTDRLRVRGAVYEVVGQPAAWSTPTGSRRHVVILLKRRVG